MRLIATKPGAVSNRNSGVHQAALRAILGAATLLLAAWVAAPWVRALLLAPLVAQADSTVADVLHGVSAPAVLMAMHVVSLLHGTPALLVFAALGAIVLWRAGLRNSMVLLLVTLPGGMLLNVGVKTAVQRARPDLDYTYQVISSFSFPSGHVAGATLLWGLIVCAFWPRIRRVGGRLALLAAAVCLVLLVATSRIILGVHYFSDCLAGILLALIWLAICLASAPLLVPTRARTR